MCEADQVGHATIEVPAMAGNHRHPAAEGPAAIRAALHDAGCEFPTHCVSVRPSTGDVVADSIRVSTQLRDAVRAVVADGDAPIVLAGSCDVAPAVLAGIRRPDAGVIWLDAHADFNTPQGSVSGFWPGMTLAIMVGDCGENVWSALDWHPVGPERVLLMGVPSLSPDEESLRLERRALRVVPWRDGLPPHDVETALEALAQDVDDVYLHLDLDVLDPSTGRGVVDPPVAGGLSSSQLAEIITEIRERLGLAGATIGTYTPTNDDGWTLHVAIDSIRQLTGDPS